MVSGTGYTLLGTKFSMLAQPEVASDLGIWNNHHQKASRNVYIPFFAWGSSQFS